jgi:bacillithiol biosynthesis cysteine-adding enzyme BshC
MRFCAHSNVFLEFLLVNSLTGADGFSLIQALGSAGIDCRVVDASLAAPRRSMSRRVTRCLRWATSTHPDRENALTKIATSTPASAWDWLAGPAPSQGDARCGLRWHPSELEACLTAREAAPVAPLAEPELAELRTAHAAWGADATSLAALERLAEPATRAIVTGQQPGLFAGPLLTIHKALGAILLARRLTERHPGRAFVPVFWVAGEDHDFNEVRRASWPGASGELTTIELPTDGWVAGRMVGGAATGPWAEAWARQVEADAPPTEHREAVVESIRVAYGGEQGNLEDGFCRLLFGMLAGLGLVVVTPRMRWLRRRATPILLRELERGDATSRAINACGEAIERAGRERGLRRPDGNLNFFWIDSKQRRWAIRRLGERLARQPAGGEGGEPVPIDAEALAGQIQAEPECFSTNVVTRPLLQDAALPTVAQVIGPGEAAYLEQVESVYGDFGVFAPVRWPRPRAVLVEPRVERRLAKHGLTLEDALAALEQGGDAATLADLALRRAEAAAGTDTEPETGAGDDPLALVEDLAARQLDEIARLGQALEQRLGQDPAIVGSARKLGESLKKGYAKLGERVAAARRARDGQLIRSMTLAAASLRPKGLPQERLLNPLAPFAVNFGLDWPARLAERLSIDPAAGLQVVRLASLAGDAR